MRIFIRKPFLSGIVVLFVLKLFLCIVNEVMLILKILMVYVEILLLHFVYSTQKPLNQQYKNLDNYI